MKPVATRLFFPVLESASIEDDDEMQTRWAALLANEAICVGSVHPSFIETLKQLAPDDARLLDRIFDSCKTRRTRTIEWSVVFPPGQRRQLDEEGFENLVRLGLVALDYDLIEGGKQLKLLGSHAQVVSNPKLKEDYILSDVAVRFVEACREPHSTWL
jgi:hypothetical protein